MTLIGMPGRFAFLAALLAALPVSGVCADAFDIRPIAQIPTGAAKVAGTKSIDLSKYLRSNDRLVLSSRMDADEAGTIYLNFDRITIAGWKGVPDTRVFELKYGRPPEDAAELSGWRDRRSKTPLAQTDADKRLAWDAYVDGQHRDHPGFEPVEERRPLLLKISPNGELIEALETRKAPEPSGLIPPQEISKDEFEWFKMHASLSEFSDKREKITWREKGHEKSVERGAEFRDGLRLGEDARGDVVYLMTITMPFLRPHRHGTSDYVARIYVVSQEKRIVQVAPAYQTVQMHRASRNLYELYNGPYEGLMPALNEPKVQPMVIRVWKAN